MKFSKKMIVTVFVSLFLFSTIVLYFSWMDKTIPDSLIYSMFGLGSAESGVLGWLKVIERKTKNKICEELSDIESVDANEEENV